MSFARSELLAAIPLVLALLGLGLMLRWRRMRRLADALGEAAAARILPADAALFPTAASACLLVAVLAICIVAAGPGETPVRAGQATPPLDIAIVVDASMSMGASDIEPSRIERASAVVSQLSQTAPKGRLGMMIMGDWVYALAPPTDDRALVDYFARSLSAKLLSDLASAVRTSTGDRSASVKDAIDHARTALTARRDRKARQVILLISDGAIPDDEKEAVAAATDAAKADIEVWTAGVGTSSETPLELGGRPVLDASGDPVMADFNPKLLRAVARAGGGAYENVDGDAGLRSLISGLRGVVGLAGPDDIVPQRIAVVLLVLAILLLAAEGALNARRLAVVRRWIWRKI